MSSKKTTGPDKQAAEKPYQESLAARDTSFREHAEKVLEAAKQKLIERGGTRNIEGFDIDDYAYEVVRSVQRPYKTFMPMIYIKLMRLQAVDRARQKGKSNNDMAIAYMDDLIDVINYSAFEYVLIERNHDET